MGGTRSLIRFVESEIQFLIYTVLEWILIGILFLNEFLTFAANEFASFFHMKIPCQLCSSNSDHVLVHKDSNCYCNNSICEFHKKGISSMAYCHSHKKLSDIRKMCEACLLSFATERESDCDTYKSLVGVLNKDLECFVGDDIEIQLGLTNDYVYQETSSSQKCSCCGQPLKVKKFFRPKTRNADTFSQAKVNNSCRKSKELIPKSDYSEPEEDDNISNVNQLKEDTKEEADTIKEENKTSHEDFAPNSPRCHYRRQSTMEKTRLISESNEASIANEGEEDEAMLNLPSREVRLDRKPLMALYMELDEERNASAVAANNAIAMITKLQDEKAAIQMEALQFQRLMEEEVEHDEESLRVTNEVLVRKEIEVMELENELALYREKYGSLMEDDEFLELNKNMNAEEKDPIGHQTAPTQVNFEEDKAHILGQMKEQGNGNQNVNIADKKINRC